VGQQQRLCLARGLAVEPQVLLCDEPTASLDPVSAKHIEERFVELKKDYTIILVTHILRQAKRLADYVLFFYMGELVEHGPAEKLLNDPQDQRTKDYLAGTIS
jgi:phosphate transport system ATP-binding protein